MSGFSRSSAEPLSVAGERRVNEVCNRFEKAWKAGQRPRIEEYLGDTLEPERSVLLRELIALDIDYRRRAGETPRVEEYQAQFPSPCPPELTEPPDTVPPTLVGTAPADTLKAPKIPGYEILDELGQGGMGIVYRAWQTGLHRLVALKMILAGAHASAHERSRFRTEAEAVARLQHPHIVQIHEVGQQGLLPYMALEYVDGGSLDQKLDGTPLPTEQAARWVAMLARAVHYAHQRGIVHRDIKPANVLLARGEPPQGLPLGGRDDAGRDHHYEPKLTDFGLAKLLVGGRPTLTQSGAFLGTPTYMAPEQAAGRSKDIGPATDVYALGAILYELLTGRPPFKAETAQETVAQVQSQEPVSPSRLRPKLPRDLTTICLKCLEKQPQKRYASAEALAEDLDRFLAGEPIKARPIRSPEKLWRWCRRRPALASLIASVVVLLVLVAGGSLTAAVLFKQQRDATRLALARSYLAQATSGRLTGQEGQSLGGLKLIHNALDLLGPQQRESAEALALRNEAVACLATTDLSVLQQQDSGIQADLGADSFDSRLERYTYADPADRSVVIRRLMDNEVLQRLPPPAGVRFWYSHARFSPDDRFLAIHYAQGDGGMCIVWDLLTSKEVLKVSSVDGWDFHPDRRTFAARTTDEALHLYQLPEGKETKTIALKGQSPMILRFDPSGRRLAAASEARAPLQILDVATGKVDEITPHLANLKAVDWSKDGRWLATGGDDRRVYVYDAQQLRLQSVLVGHENAVINVSFGPSENLLASSSWDGTTRLWDPVSGKQWIVASGVLWGVRWDSGWIGFKNSNTYGIWEVAGRRVCRTLHHGAVGNSTAAPTEEGPVEVDFSSDGRLLASAGDDGVRLWDAATAQELAHLAIGFTRSAQFNPQGSSLATYGLAGLHGWPVPAAESNRFHIGPAEALQPFRSYSWLRASWDRRGQRLAYTDFNHHRAHVFKAGQRARRTVLSDPSAQVHVVALSPEGNWVATGARFDANVKIWEADTGKLMATLPGSQPLAHVYQAAFSPDNRWLVVGSGRDYRWWRVGSWEPGGTITKDGIFRESPLAFAPDSSLLAITRTAHTVQLVDPASGQELATLAAPDRHLINWLCFNHDGSQLAVSTPDHIVQLWDLRLLRDGLAGMGLDWSRPPYARPQEGEIFTPLRVDVELGDAVWPKPAPNAASMQQGIGIASFVLAWNPFNFYAYQHRGDAYAFLNKIHQSIKDYSLALACMPLGHSRRSPVLHARAGLFERLQEFARTRADLEQILERVPDDADACNGLAWLLATGPQTLRDLPRALDLAKKAVELTPGEWMYVNTLGVAYYRLGHYKEAVEALERSYRDSKGEYAAYDLFFLAMSHARLGDAAKSKECYDGALRWMQNQQGRLPAQAMEELKKELDPIRAEARRIGNFTEPQ